MEKIQKNLNDIERKATKSNKIVAKGPKMNLGDAIKLGRKSNSIVSTIKKGIKEYGSFEPSEEQAKKIFVQMTGIVEVTETQLNLLVQNKATFEKLHVGGLVKKNMNKSSEASNELAKVMLAKTPASIKPQAEELENRRKTAFDRATVEFAQSVGGEDQADGEDDSD